MSSPSTTGRPLDDAASRQLIETRLTESLLVEAAAGTGKTTELVRRVVAVLASGTTTVDRIVAVTFTRKAAGELKLRLRQELGRAVDRAASGAAEHRHLGAALARLEEASIGTIHSFCAEILRERPVEAGVDPAFVELDEEDAAALYDRAFQSWIETRLDDPPEGLRRALSRLAGKRTFDGASPIERLRDAGRGLVDWRDFPAPWQRRSWDRPAEIARLVERVGEISDLCRRCTNHHDYLRRALAPAADLATWIERSRRVGAAGDADETEAQLVALGIEMKRNAGWKGRGKWFADGVLRSEAITARDAFLAELEAFREQADADLAALLHGELGEVIDGYERLKRATGRLDFLDLLVRARDLVRDNSAVRRYLQERFSHLFVDELQDTDPLQAEILLLLAADDPETIDWQEARPTAGKLFLVGDPKQSIYRFRRADVLFYQGIKDRLAAAGVRVVHLTRSFRSVRPLQRAVNAAFAGQMTGDVESGQPEYIPLDRFRDARPEQPQVVALPPPAPFAYSRVTARQIDACLPDTVAAFVAWLIEDSGWTVVDKDRGGERVPIEPRHVALLFRRFLTWGRDVSRPYLRGLEARGIPHLLVGGRTFHEREEVETLRAALTAIEWPDDELSVFATLRGGLFALSDDLLLRFRATHGSPHPFRRLPADLADDYLPVAEALRLLARLHRHRNDRPIVDSLHELLEATRAHAGLALRPAGYQVLANVQRICDRARAFEMRGGLSFRGFVEGLDEAAGRPSGGQPQLLEEGADGVRLLTVHAAKGLEFPVVVLADITAGLTTREPSLYADPAAGLCAQRLLGWAPWELREQAEREIERDRAEGVRLAYVAATRARDLLVVPAVGSGPWRDGWTGPLDAAIYPPRDAWAAAEPAPGCPPFGSTTVLRGPEDGDAEAIAPGLHRPQVGEHGVVWWDPATLRLDVPGNFGLRRERILSPDDAAGEEGVARYTEWRTARRDALDDGARPSLDVLTVSEARDEEPPGPPTDIRVEALPRPARRPAGKRFGILVHTILRDAPLDAGEEAVGELAALHGRTLGAPSAEVEAAKASVAAALGHPLLVRAKAADSCHRESPFLVPLGDGRVLEGTLDLAFRERGAWTVVDFKTDAETADLDAYRRQLGWYVFALATLKGEPVSGVLLGV